MLSINHAVPKQHNKLDNTKFVSEESMWVWFHVDTPEA